MCPHYRRKYEARKFITTKRMVAESPCWQQLTKLAPMLDRAALYTGNMPTTFAGTLRSTRLTLEMVKWEHSIFALPFALTGAVLAAGGWPHASTLLWIVV